MKNHLASRFSLVAILAMISYCLPTAYGARETYGVIVDCGSSGTRAHIFEWSSGLDFTDRLNDVEPMRNDKGVVVTKKITPGLSSLNGEPERAGQYLEPILKFVTDNIPKHAHKSTSIHILATAGMRLLDQETQNKIMNNLYAHLQKNYEFSTAKTKVISGAAEGMYQWITVNSMYKMFMAIASTTTYGVIEMGGASVQVTYHLRITGREMAENSLPQDKINTFRKQIIVPRISRDIENADYHLFSATFLGMGSNSVRQAYIDLLVRTSHGRSRTWYIQTLSLAGNSFEAYADKSPLVLGDPCLPPRANDAIRRPLKLFRSKKQSIGFRLDDEDEQTFPVILRGTGDYNKCKQLLESLIVRAKRERMNCKEREACPMSLLGEHYVPFTDLKIIGLGDFYHTTKEMLDSAGKYDRKSIIKKTKDICSTPFKKLLVTYPNANRKDESRVRLECFKAIWIDTFLHKGLGIKEDHDFATINEINGDPIEWALGAVLDNSIAGGETTETHN